MFWLDSSELGTAAFTLGVAHSPGHPLAALLGRAATLLPLGSVALKVGFAQALCGALAAMQTARLGEHVARRMRFSAGGAARPREDALYGAAAGLLFGLSWAAAFQAVRPEVYALSAVLVISCALELARFDETDDRRHLYLAALWAGLALSNHHLLALAVIAPGLLFVIARRPAPRLGTAFGRVCLAGALGLLLFVYLPLRAAHDPLVDWGAPTTWGRIWWTVSARAFQKAVAHASSGNLPAVLAAMVVELHPLGALLALSGLYVMVRRRPLRRLGLFLFGAGVLHIAARALVGFDVGNPDAYGYLEAGVALLAVCACALPVTLSAMARGPAPRGAALTVASLLLAGTLVKGALGFRDFALTRDYDAETVLGTWLDHAPSRALAITSYYQTIFGLYYLRGVEGRRPDVDLLHRHFLAYPGDRAHMIRRRPLWAQLTSARDVDPEKLLASNRPLVIEYDVDLPDALVARSQAVPVPVSRELQGRRYEAWERFLAAHRACRLGDRAALAQAIASAREIVGDSPDLAELAASCGSKLRSPFDR